MRYSNLHTHTVFSDGNHTVEETIMSAIDAGMISLGFSDHCYTYFDTSYCVQADNVKNYISEVRRQAEAYKDKIEIYLGIELDGFATLENRAAYDYIIGDCHYVITPDGYRAVDLSKSDLVSTIDNYFGGDGVRLALSYYESYAECVAKMKPEILGHIDLVTKYGLVDTTDKHYRAAAVEALDASLKVCPIIELNTGAISRGYKKLPYPEDFLLDEIRERGGRIILSSDSHSKDSLTCFFDNSVELLKAHGFKSVVIMKNHSFEEMGI